MSKRNAISLSALTTAVLSAISWGGGEAVAASFEGDKNWVVSSEQSYDTFNLVNNTASGHVLSLQGPDAYLTVTLDFNVGANGDSGSTQTLIGVSLGENSILETKKHLTINAENNSISSNARYSVIGLKTLGTVLLGSGINKVSVVDNKDQNSYVYGVEVGDTGHIKNNSLTVSVEKDKAGLSAAFYQTGGTTGLDSLNLSVNNGSGASYGFFQSGGIAELGSLTSKTTTESGAAYAGNIQGGQLTAKTMELTASSDSNDTLGLRHSSGTVVVHDTLKATSKSETGKSFALFTWGGELKAGVIELTATSTSGEVNGLRQAGGKLNVGDLTSQATSDSANAWGAKIWGSGDLIADSLNLTAQSTSAIASGMEISGGTLNANTMILYASSVSSQAIGIRHNSNVTTNVGQLTATAQSDSDMSTALYLTGGQLTATGIELSASSKSRTANGLWQQGGNLTVNDLSAKATIDAGLSYALYGHGGGYLEANNLTLTSSTNSGSDSTQNLGIFAFDDYSLKVKDTLVVNINQDNSTSQSTSYGLYLWARSNSNQISLESANTILTVAGTNSFGIMTNNELQDENQDPKADGLTVNLGTLEFNIESSNDAYGINNTNTKTVVNSLSGSVKAENLAYGLRISGGEFTSKGEVEYSVTSDSGKAYGAYLTNGAIAHVEDLIKVAAHAGGNAYGIYSNKISDSYFNKSVIVDVSAGDSGYGLYLKNSEVKFKDAQFNVSAQGTDAELFGAYLLLEDTIY